ncbi:hypothetical protein BDV11DRAFT_175674 [Aspergillus similis]
MDQIDTVKHHRPEHLPSAQSENNNSEVTIFDLHPNNFILQRIYAPIYRNFWRFIISIFAFWILYYQTCTRCFGFSGESCDQQVHNLLFGIKAAAFLLWCYVMWLKQT